MFLDWWPTRCRLRRRKEGSRMEGAVVSIFLAIIYAVVTITLNVAGFLFSHFDVVNSMMLGGLAQFFTRNMEYFLRYSSFVSLFSMYQRLAESYLRYSRYMQQECYQPSSCREIQDQRLSR